MTNTDQAVIVLPLIECTVILAVCGYLLRGYIDRERTPMPLIVATYIGWILSFSLMVFTPLDVYLSHRAQENPETMSQIEKNMNYVLLTWWETCYWGGTFLGYFVIPLM